MEITKAPKTLQSRMRDIHRVLGFLAVGMVIVYALSGIILIHRTGGLMRMNHETVVALQPGLTADDVASGLDRRRLAVTAETENKIEFKDGSYDKVTGQVVLVKKEYPGFVKKMVSLHKLADGKNHTVGIMTTVFGVVLFLLAVTSLFMYNPRSRRFKANMLYTAIGVVFTIVLVLLC